MVLASIRLTFNCEISTRSALKLVVLMKSETRLETFKRFVLMRLELI